MTQNGVLQIVIFLLCLFALVKPLGWYMAQVFTGKPCGLNSILAPLERFIYWLSGIDAKQEMSWKQYLAAMLIFNLFGMLAMYAILRLQHFLPLNPQGFNNVKPILAFNTAASFTTNTNWQNYAGEATLSYLTQMLALTVQNFLSVATSMAILIALIRGIARQESQHIGNFWVDTTRGTLYIFLPLAIIFAVFLSSQGVIQNFKPYQKINLLEPIHYQQAQIDASGKAILNANNEPLLETKTLSTQTIPMGPVASQIAIKQLGSNGGGFFNTNSAHPFENPTALSNFFEMLAILLVPAALCYTFGIMIKDKKQGWAIFTAMLILFLPLALVTVVAEQHGNPALATLGIASTSNMEGKETRIGITNSAFWAATTTATSSGSVNNMHSSLTPLTSIVILWLMHLGEIAFGGAGSGLYGMIMLIIITVFIGGLMVGRSPEYLGKKIEPYEMKMAAVAVLLMPLTILLLIAVGCVLVTPNDNVAHEGAHGFTEILYAFTSMGNNNGSAMAALNTNTPFYNIVGGLEMLFMRYWIAIPTLAIAGSLARKKTVRASLGTLPTHTPFFIVMIIGIVIITGALTFFPALSLGPIVEQLAQWEQYGN